MLEDDDSTSWILTNPVPWCAAILRPAGEPCEAPGLDSYTHPGCNSELLSRLHRIIRGRGQSENLNEATDSIVDLLDALDAAARGTAPQPGRTHPYSGWLAQPIENWPIIDTVDALAGDPYISERIIQRISGYNAEIGSIAPISD